MKDFFVSYTGVDKNWAVWIAWVLEEAGYSSVVQAWDFRPGSNFVLDMQRALQEAKRIIAVLTPAYVQSDYCGVEWAAGVAADPTGLARKVVPVRVAPCEPPGLLRAITYIDLVDLNEETARKVLLDGLNDRRMKPQTPPQYPGAARPRSAPTHPAFPAATAVSKGPSPAPYIPRLRQKATDLDVQRFMRASFDEIRRYFERGLGELKHADARFATESQQIHNSKFIAEVYVDGALRRRAKVWLGPVMGSGVKIGYVEGNGVSVDQDNTMNEMLTAVSGQDGLCLKAVMHAGAVLSQEIRRFDPERLTSQEAAEYLWLRFVAWLEH
jgi:hypothetical protein